MNCSLNTSRKKEMRTRAWRFCPKARPILLVEFGGESRAETDEQARQMMARVKHLGRRAPVDMKLYDDPKQEEMIWAVREGGLGQYGLGRGPAR